MKRRVLLISMLLFVTVLVDCAMLLLPRDVSRSSPCVSVVAAVLHAQAVLLAIWAGLARGPLPWRLSGMIAGIALCNIPRCLLGSMEPFSLGIAAWTVLGSVQVVHIVAILLAARRCGFRLELHSNGGSHKSSNPAKSRYQFSLRYLLWWTTGLAVLLSMVRCITLYAEGEDYGYPHKVFVSFWRYDSPMLVSVALIALAAVWTALGRRWLLLRVILLVSVVAAAGMAGVWVIVRLSLFLSFDLTEWHDSVMFSYLPLAAWIVASLYVFRVAGYRIVWRRPMWWVAGAKRSGAPEAEDS